jgi:hypothetical protein
VQDLHNHLLDYYFKRHQDKFLVDSYVDKPSSLLWLAHPTSESDNTHKDGVPYNRTRTKTLSNKIFSRPIARQAKEKDLYREHLSPFSGIMFFKRAE